MLYRRWRGFWKGMNLRWRPTGAANKPPCGAVAKIHGVERTRKRLINGAGKDNGDERKWTNRWSIEIATHCQNYGQRAGNRTSLAVTCLLAKRQPIFRWHEQRRTRHATGRCHQPFIGQSVPTLCFWYVDHKASPRNKFRTLCRRHHRALSYTTGSRRNTATNHNANGSMQVGTSSV